MGQDVSIIFTPRRVDDAEWVRLVTSTFVGDLPSNLALLFSDESSDEGAVLPIPGAYSVLTIWGDGDADVDLVGQRSSQHLAEKVLVLTVVEHAGIGGWQCYVGGKLDGTGWVDVDDVTEDYLLCPVRGFEASLGIKLGLSAREAISFVPTLAHPLRGLCLASSSPELVIGRYLNGRQILAILEDDVPNAVFECSLAEGA